MNRTQPVTSASSVIHPPRTATAPRGTLPTGKGRIHVTDVEVETKAGGLQRILDFIERVGNKVPHPAVLFVGLCVGLIVLSQLLAWMDWSATYEVVER